MSVLKQVGGKCIFVFNFCLQCLKHLLVLLKYLVVLDEISYIVRPDVEKFAGRLLLSLFHLFEFLLSLCCTHKLRRNRVGENKNPGR